VVALGLVGVRVCERADRVVERVIVAEVPRDRGRVARTGVTPREGPAAEPAPRAEVVERHRVDDSATLLILELPEVQVSAERSDRPAEQDVTGCLEPTLAHDDPLAVGGMDTGREVALEDRRLGLLDLEEERVLATAAVEK